MNIICWFAGHNWTSDHIWSEDKTKCLHLAHCLRCGKNKSETRYYPWLDTNLFTKDLWDDTWKEKL